MRLWLCFRCSFDFSIHSLRSSLVFLSVNRVYYEKWNDLYAVKAFIVSAGVIQPRPAKRRTAFFRIPDAVSPLSVKSGCRQPYLRVRSPAAAVFPKRSKELPLPAGNVSALSSAAEELNRWVPQQNANGGRTSQRCGYAPLSAAYEAVHSPDRLPTVTV